MISSILSIFKSKSKLFVGAIIIALTGALAYNIYNYGQLEEQNKNLNVQYAELVSNQTQLRIRAKEQQESLSELRNNNQDILTNYNRAIEDIQELRTMKPEEVRKQTPVIKKRLNNDYIELQNKFSCVTGDISKCSNK